MQYEVYGEFPIAKNGSLVSRAKGDKSAFWAAVEETESGLSEACGCYVL